MYQPTNSPLSLGIPDEVRSRILLVLEDAVLDHSGDFPLFLEQIGRAVAKKYGFLSQSSFLAARRSQHPVIEHFFSCGEDQLLHTLELCFRQEALRGNQQTVDEINTIFRECWIGYAFTSFVEREVESEVFIVPGWKQKATSKEYEYPKAIRSTDQFLDKSVSEPTFALLSDSRLHVANSEMGKAHSALRAGNYDDAITLCAAAFESLLKTICDAKGWTYDKDKDTCGRLIEICHKNGLFESFYLTTFLSICTIRNKLGDAHGRGPVRASTPTLEHAEHMVYLTSTNMLLLAKLAGLS